MGFLRCSMTGSYRSLAKVFLGFLVGHLEGFATDYGGRCRRRLCVCQSRPEQLGSVRSVGGYGVSIHVCNPSGNSNSKVHIEIGKYVR